MKLLIVLCLVAVAWTDRNAKPIRHIAEWNQDGSYKFDIKTSNGIEAQESGIAYPGLKNETGNYVRTGSYSYTWEGVTYTVDWRADENGYSATGSHLPL